MNMKKLRAWWVFLAFVSLLGSTAAQGTIARFTGRVLNPDGTPISNAAVTILSDNVQRASVHTDKAGVYTSPALTAGIYSLTFVAEGLTPTAVENIRLKAGQTYTLNTILKKP